MEIKQFWNMFKKRYWLVLGCVLIAVATTWYYSANVVPIYSASSNLLVNKTTVAADGSGEVMDVNALQSNIELTSTYQALIGSSAIMDKVANDYPELKASSDELLAKVKVGSLSKTPVLYVSVDDTDYQWAAMTANAVAETFKNEVPNLLKIDNVSVLTKAPLDIQPRPINDNMQQNILLSFVVSLLFSFGIILLWEYLDTRLKSEEEITEFFGAPALTSVAKLKPKDYQANYGNNPALQTGEAHYAAANR